MAKKFTYEYIKNYFEKKGCELLEKEYVNRYTSMKYKCKCATITRVCFRDFKKGIRCSYCGGKSKKTLEFIENELNKNGYTLIEKEYKNCYTKMKTNCPKGHEYLLTWNDFRNGCRCRTCAIENRSGKLHPLWILDREEAKFRKIIRIRCRNLLKITMANMNIKKNQKTREILGYSSTDFFSHITIHRNWDALKNSRWHIDHIFPIKAFLDYNIIDFKIINALDNLQPMIGSENISKHDKYNPAEFEAWLLSKNVFYEQKMFPLY